MITHIFLTTIVPILVMVAIGFAMDRKFSMDLDTLSKINFYVVSPAFLFTNTYTYVFTPESSQVIWLTVIGFAVTWLGSYLLERASRMDTARAGIMRNAILFNNCGNIGVPLIVFIYSNEPFLQGGEAIWLQAAIGIQIVVFAFQNIVTNSFGFYFASSGKMSARDALAIVFKMPIIYSIALALALNVGGVPIKDTPIWPIISNISNALVMIALFTLGVQLSRTPFNFWSGPVLWGSTGRLIMGPLLIWLTIVGYSLWIEPVGSLVSQVLIISAAVPSGVTTALIAAILHSHAEYATQLVVATTVLSAVTLPCVIMFSSWL